MISRDTRKGEFFFGKGLTSRDAFGDEMTAIPKPRREKSEAYLEWLRTLPCIVEKHQSWSYACKGPIEAHHITPKMGGKVGSKTDDKRALPFCHSHHLEYHALGSIDAFESRYPVILEYEIVKHQKAYRAPAKQKREKRIGIIRVTVRCLCKQGTHDFPASKVVHTETGLYWHCPNLRDGATRGESMATLEERQREMRERMSATRSEISEVRKKQATRYREIRRFRFQGRDKILTDVVLIRTLAEQAISPDVKDILYRCAAEMELMISELDDKHGW